MWATIFTLRWKQTIRLLRELGLLRVLFLGGLALVASISCYHLLAKQTWEILPLWSALLLSTHFNRKDGPFLKHLDLPRFRLYFMEYGLLSVPLILTLFSLGQFLIAFALFIPVFLLAWVKPKAPKWSFKKGTLLLPNVLFASFEWRSGLRNYGWILLGIWLGGWIGAQYDFLILLVFFGMALTTSLFYQECEAKELLEVLGDSPLKILKRKILLHLGLYYALALPFIILFLLLHRDLILFLFITLFICTIFQMLAIFLKYAMYVPTEPINKNLFSFWLSCSVICLCIPFLQPIPLVMTFRFFQRAKTNLVPYLDAKN